MAAHTARGTPHKWSTRSIAFCRLALRIAHDLCPAAGTGSAGIPGIDAGGDDALVPRLVFGVLEDATLHPESPFPVAPATILAFRWLEGAQMFKHQNRRPMLLGKLDNVSTDEVGDLLIACADLAPQGGIVLFACGNDASPGPVACNPSKQLLPKSSHITTTAEKP